MYAAGGWLVRRQVNWFAIEPGKVRPILYQPPAWYKLMIVMFNFTPWLAVMVVNATG